MIEKVPPRGRNAIKAGAEFCRHKSVTMRLLHRLFALFIFLSYLIISRNRAELAALLFDITSPRSPPRPISGDGYQLTDTVRLSPTCSPALRS
jgi:hypothetical protein